MTMTTTITFRDHNQNRDNPAPYTYKGRDIRIIYASVWDEATVVASYVEGTERDGSGDGWKVETTGDLYSDIQLGSI